MKMEPFDFKYDENERYGKTVALDYATRLNIIWPLKTFSPKMKPIRIV